MDYFLLLKEVKETTPELEFEEKMSDVRRLISLGIKDFLIKGVSLIFTDMELRFPIALETLVKSLSPFIERTYFLKCETRICKEFILPHDDGRRFNKEKISDNLKIINDIIRTFINGSKSYYLITNQEKLLRDLVYEVVDEIDLIINNKISIVFNVTDKEFEVSLEFINNVKGT